MAVTTIELAMRSQDACWNRERWEKLPNDGNRYEVIDGVLYMSTSPTTFHQWIVMQTYDEMKAQIADKNIGLLFFAPLGVFMPGCDPVQPDLFVLRTEDTVILRDGRVHGVPALIVEVLSPSHPDYDLRIKRQA
ncbi:MAG TPA: Uma2 family endonuclease, partial [Chloroflexota bacterium]|nr:Uma2 family endonuclease [Chloroflexota bacterium]